MRKNYNLTRRTCYFACLANSSVFVLPPLLFVTFRQMYGVSYTLLGTLVLVNFCTQLIIDLIFTFFARHFNIEKTIRLMPFITATGLFVYAVFPMLFSDLAYIGLLIGTVIFSVAAGLCEVLLSSLVAALPSGNPERDMSMLHSIYGWGVVSVVLISTLFFNLFGAHNWPYLMMLFVLLSLLACFFFCISPIPEMDVSHNKVQQKEAKRKVGLFLCAACIFFGSAAENVMTNWISGYMENALHIPKTYGDIFGLALFAILLGTGRSLYAKYGRNISKVMLLSMVGAFVCYLFAGLFPNAVVALVACVIAGLCTSLLWPGTLILMEEKVPSPGVAAYALMAAGGDFGASVAPQTMGIIVDVVSMSAWAENISAKLGVSPEQIGMKAGMLFSAIFPLLGILVILAIIRYFRDKKESG